jgi:DNA-binding CsgD family transcriptional regulator
MSSREGYRWQSRPWSPSEMQARILDGVTRGLTNAQIAAEVGISPDGVKWHISRALSETGLDGRSDLALWWQSPKSDIDFRLDARPPGTRAGRLDYGPTLRAMASSSGARVDWDHSWRILTPPPLDVELAILECPGSAGPAGPISECGPAATAQPGSWGRSPCAGSPSGVPSESLLLGVGAEQHENDAQRTRLCGIEPTIRRA